MLYTPVFNRPYIFSIIRAQSLDGCRVVCNSFTHTCVIDPMPIADGQFSSPSSVVGDDGEKVQKTSSKHELKLQDNIGVRFCISGVAHRHAQGWITSLPTNAQRQVGNSRRIRAGSWPLNLNSHRRKHHIANRQRQLTRKKSDWVLSSGAPSDPQYVDTSTSQGLTDEQTRIKNLPSAFGVRSVLSRVVVCSLRLAICKHVD